MTSPSHTHWRLAYKFRGKAYQERANAAKAGAEMLAFDVLPGATATTLAALLKNLDDPKAHEKAKKLLAALRTAKAKARRKSRKLLGKNPSGKAIDLFEERTEQWEDLMMWMVYFEYSLGRAHEFDAAEFMMTELGDAFATLGR